MAKLGRKLKWLVFFLGHGVVSGNINYRYIFEGFFFSENCRQTGVGWLKSTNLQFFRCYVFVTYRNKVDIIAQ